MEKQWITTHFKREFLAPEETRYDQSYCQSYVYLQPESALYDTGEFNLETELIIGDGHSVINLDLAHYSDQEDEYLAALTNLMNHIIEYRQAVAEAIARKHGQGVTQGNGTTILSK